MSVRETQVVAEVVTGVPSNVRLSQLVAEAVTGVPSTVRLSQLVCEVVHDAIPAPVVSTQLIVFSSGD